MLRCAKGDWVGSAAKNGLTEVASEWSEESRAAALAQLSRVLESHHFRSSKRCSHFLRYVVEHTVNSGHPEPLKERTLGIEIFGRNALYDTAQDPVVRTTAGEVRKRLAQYYLESDTASEIRIALPAGGYVPEIHFTPVVPAASVPQPIALAPAPVGAMSAPVPAIRERAFKWRPLAAGVALAIVAVAAVMAAVQLRTTNLERFWSPFVQAPGPVIIVLGQPKTYLFELKTQDRLDHLFESGGNTAGASGADGDSDSIAPVETARLESIPLREVVPSWERHLSIGDVMVFSRISSLLVQKGQKVELHGVRDTSLANLRGKPSVLVGAFNNQWNLGLTGELRFYFEDDGDHANYVRDRKNPGANDWKVMNTWPRPHPPTDYAIVSRVVNSTTEQTVVSIAGITGFGTQAAGEFLTNEAYFTEALKNAPPDWKKKNMQVVLGTKVMSGAAGPPQVLAVEFW